MRKDQMSRRCQIIVADHNARLYKHSDGYPEGVLPTLLPTLAEFAKHRADQWDGSYVLANIAAAFLIERANWWKEYQQTSKGIGEACPELPLLGYGIEANTANFHSDEDYLYVVHPDHVDVLKTAGASRRGLRDGFCDQPFIEKTKLVSRVDFQGKKLMEAAQ